MSYELYKFIDFFFFNDTATTEIYTLSLHDALPICLHDVPGLHVLHLFRELLHRDPLGEGDPDRKSTRLNSSHSQISYAVFCLKKKKIKTSSHASSAHHCPNAYGRTTTCTLRPHPTT